MDKEKCMEELKTVASDQEQLISDAHIREIKKIVENMTLEEKRVAAVAIMSENPEIVMDAVGSSFKELMDFKNSIAKTCVNFYEARQNWV